MVNFKICVRNQRKDGFWSVYIRIVHKTRPAYIRTRFAVRSCDIDRDGTVKDVFVAQSCMNIIVDYVNRLNETDISGWSVMEIKKYLESDRSDMTFSDFADAFVRRMINLDQDNNAKIYMSAVKNLRMYLGVEQIRFTDLSRANLDGWIASLRHTRRARSLYPTCVRTIFRKAMAQSQEPASRLPRKIYDPWGEIDIPWSEAPRKKAVSAADCRKFFGFTVDASEPRATRATLGRDMALLSLCLAGINTVDLFKLKKKEYKGGIIGYYRSKTSGRRKDGAYFEIEVPEMVKPLIERYRADDVSPHLLWFADRYADAKTFNTTVNQGIRQVCKAMGMADDECWSFYTFRHTWATIAQNHCGATLDEIGFAMNHSTHRVTRGYIAIDFSPAWELNRKVIGFVFPPADTAADGDVTTAVTDGFAMTKSDMIYARAYFRGKALAEITNIGFGSADDVVARLFRLLPDDIPAGATVSVKVVNLDTDRAMVLQRQKPHEPPTDSIRETE